MKSRISHEVTSIEVSTVGAHLAQETLCSCVEVENTASRGDSAQKKGTGYGCGEVGWLLKCQYRWNEFPSFKPEGRSGWRVPGKLRLMPLDDAHEISNSPTA